MAKRQVFFSFHYANPTLTAKREYYGIGEVMIAFGIKFSIDSGCRGDVLFEAKTPELARHYEKDFHARQVATLNSGGRSAICWPMKTHGISLKNFLQRRNRNGKDAG